jgi:hypothetical protein
MQALLIDFFKKMLFIVPLYYAVTVIEYLLMS